MHKNNSQSNPLISFIITTYNLPGELLQKAISSAINLTLTNDEREIIVVDDGSDEVNTIEEIGNLIDEVKYVRQKNGGPASARNTGLNIAQGTYIQFIDGDDYLLRTPFEHCLDIVRYENPDMVIFKSTDKNSKTVPFSYEGPTTGAEYMRNNNLRAAVWGYIFKRNALGSLRFNTDIYLEDEDFTPQLVIRCERVFTTEAEAYFYLQRNNSIMHTSNPKKDSQTLKDAESIILHLQEISQSIPEEERVAMERRIAQLTMDHIYNIMCKTKSSKHVEEAIERLSQHNLFPLPDKDYTKKYKLFRKMSMTPLGRKAMIAALSFK